MKFQALTFCALLAAPAVIAGGDQNQNQHQKRWGVGTNDGNLPAFLALYDVNDNGVIEPDEKLAMEQAREQIRKQLRTDWDANGDGQICDQEREQARLQLREMIDECRAARFLEAAGEDEMLDYDEFKTLPGMAKKLPDNEAKVQEIFDRIDTDDDGLISLEEFLAALKKCDGPKDGGGGGPKARTE